MKILRDLKKCPSVGRIFNLENVDPNAKINLLFFICPKMRNPGIVMEHGVLTAQYVPGLPGFAEDRILRVKEFLDGLRKVGVDFDIKAIFAAADSFILFPSPIKPPEPVPTITEIEVVSNLEVCGGRLEQFVAFCEKHPWDKVPARLLEEQRLKKLLPFETPREVKEAFVSRTFAGFALDGLVVSDGVFGKNPVILGVESPGVPMLQNTALTKPIPVIELE